MTSEVKMILKGVSFLILILTVEGEWKGKDCPVDEAIGNKIRKRITTIKSNPTF